MNWGRYVRGPAAIVLLMAVVHGAVAVEAPGKARLVVQTGQAEPAQSLAVSLDGRYAASGHRDVVVIWDVASGREIRTIRAHVGTVCCLAFLADGKHVVSSGEDGSIRTWSIESGAQHGAWFGHSGGTASLALSDDGTRLVSAPSFGGDLKVLDDQLRLITSIPRAAGDGFVQAVAWLPDGRTVAMADAKGFVSLWDVSGSKLERRIEAHKGGYAYALAISSDGKRLASTGHDNKVKEWSLPKGQLSAMYTEESDVRAVTYSPSGVQLAYAAGAGMVVRAIGGQVLRRFPAVYPMVYTPDGGHLLADGPRGTGLGRWNTATGVQEPKFGVEVDALEGLVLPERGSALVTHGQTVQIWDLTAGHLVGRIAKEPGQEIWSSVPALSADGKWLAVASDVGTVLVKETSIGAAPRRFQLKGRVATAAAFAASGDSLLLATMPADAFKALLKAVREEAESLLFEDKKADSERKKAAKSAYFRFDVLDLRTGQLKAGGRFAGTASRMALAPGGRLLATGGLGGVLRLHLLDSGRTRVLEGHTEDITSLDFSAGGGMLLSASYDGSVRSWNVGSGLQVALTQNSNAVLAARFAAVGPSLLLGDRNGVRSVGTTSAASELKPPSRAPGRTLALSADGALAAFSLGGRVSVWSMRQGREQSIFTQGNLNSAMFSSSGHQLLTIDRDAVLRAWDSASGESVWNAKLSGPIDADLRIPAAASAGQVAVGVLRRLELRDLLDGNLRHELSHESAFVTALAAGTGARWAAGYSNGEVRVWHPESGRIQSFADLAARVEALAFSKDGRLLAALAGRGVTIWDTASGKLLKQHLGVAPAWARSLHFTADGASLVAGGASLMAGLTGSHSWEVKVFDVELGVERKAFGASAPVERLKPLAPDNELRAAIVEAFDLAAPVVDEPVVAPPNPLAVVLSADGRYVLSSEADGQIALHSASPAGGAIGYKGHAGAVNGLGYLQQGKFVVSSNDENTVAVWDAASGTRLLTLASFPDGTWVVFDPEGHYDTNAPESSKNLHWVAEGDARPLPIQTYADRFRVPGLLSRVLGGPRPSASH